MIKRILLLLLIGFFSTHTGWTQKGSVVSPAVAGVSNTGTGTRYYGKQDEPPRAITFKRGTVSAASFVANINRYFNIPSEFTFVEAESNTDNLGMQHRLLQQYYNGIPMEGMGYRVHEKDGFVTSANGKAVRAVNPNMQVTLSEAAAFQLAARYLQTKDTAVSKGRKLIVSKGFTLAPGSFSIAFQFDIDVSMSERWRISIDAHDGQLINKVSLVNSCRLEAEAPPLPYVTGTGKTSYYGTQTIQIEKNGTGSRLHGQTEHGGLIQTYDYGHASVLALLFGFYDKFYDFNSSTNTFNGKYYEPAVSVQWGAEKAYEYYYKKHNRNSFDNLGSAIKMYVHVDVGYDNAFWNGKLLAFGDGSNNNPLVDLDVVGHELTHGVTQYEARLQYYNESGALNESFSDILGKAVEFDTFGDTATWQLARHFRAGGLRDMTNPNLKGQPDTYVGDMWYTGYDDSGGVHTNSGVQNFWFYLLCKGGSGVNDHQVSYAINPIGMDAAVKITYRNLTEYLDVQSDYLDSRIGSLLAATDLYGENSTTYQEVDKAWDAVGVIDEPTVTSLEVYDITATTVKLKGSMIPRSDVATYHFEYGTTPALGSSTSNYSYADKIDGKITGLQSETKYYVRLVATNEHGNSYYNTEFTTISLAPLVKIKQTVDVTETTATLHAQINPNSLPTSFYFEYGPTPAFGLVTPSYPMPAATEFQDVSAPVTGLQPRQAYYYRLVATNGFASAVTTSVSFFTAARPVITSYTPATASIGTEVTITGLNFNAVPEKNLVDFGATRGTVLSASATQIKVQVPAGASLGPIAVMDAESGLAGQSVQEFVPTFTGEFKKNSLHLAMGSTDYMYQTLVQDMDGDNKPDIVVWHYLGFSVFQNVNQGGDITDASFVRSTFNTEYNPGSLDLADFDGNGLKDVVERYQNVVRIYPNFSVPGFVFFGVPVDLSIGGGDLAFNDFDLDGHIDIARTSYQGSSSTLEIFRNQNPKGSLLPENFVNQLTKSLSYPVSYLYADDLNNDGKPDLFAGANYQTFFPMLINKSLPGVLAFDEQNNVQGSMIQYPRYVSQDLNQDGWKDIVSHSPNQGVSLAILENKKTSPSISLGYMTYVLTGYKASVVQSGDIDGDGLVDLLVGMDNGKFALMKNKAEANAPLTDNSFEKFAEFGAVNSSVDSQPSTTVNDLNGDGRPEVINIYYYHQFPHDGYQMEIWQNSPSNCLDPSLTTVNVSQYSATVVLPPNTTFDQFDIQYASAGSTYWGQVYQTTLYGLSPGYSYQLRVRAKCGLGFTDYDYINFTTECANTSSFAIVSIGIDNVMITADDITSLEVQYSLAGADQWVNQSQYSNQIWNLLPGTTYDVRFRGRWCATPGAYQYKQFTTLCPKLSTLTTTPWGYGNADVRWTSSYPGQAVLEYSTDNVNWTLVDASLTLSSLIPGTKYFVRGSFACTSINSEYLYASFTTMCPKVSTIYADAITPFGANINWVDPYNAGAYTITYGHAVGEVTTVETSATSFNLEGLDPGTAYTVTISPQCVATRNVTSTTFNTICYTPLNLSVDAVTYTTAELSWDENFTGFPYSVDYSVSGSNVWATTETTSTNLSLTQLRPGTKYDVRVHIDCSKETLAYVSASFKTELYPETTYFPNPTDSKVSVHPSKNLIGNRFHIYDNMGQSVAEGELRDYTFDLSLFSPGIYVLKIEGEDPMKIVKR